MHFDQRTQGALRDAGLTTDEIREVSEAVVEATRDTASALEAFFEDVTAVYSDIDQAHTAAEFPEHHVEYLDLYTHGADLRGYLRFDTWGAYVEDGRVLTDEVVELSLGPTVHDRVRFAGTREAL